ncbi:MAG: SDR family NAD(P)-dependent oxidoreductase, partial [Gammaproteobacteria bacterium]|nr:SDR family NAD(P)-dependent oxidoreductase [Gammaproteobacteria bacterium]
ADIADWFYLRSWQGSAVLSARKHSISVGEPRSWLLFADELGVAAALREYLLLQGHTVTVVHSGSQFRRIDDEQYQLRPAEAGDYQAMLRILQSLEKLPLEIVHLWGVTAPGDDQAERLIEHCFYAPLLLLQALTEECMPAKLRMTLVSNGMQCVVGDELIVAEKATCIGPLRVIPAEFPNVICRSIDFKLAANTDNGGDKIVDWLLAELSASHSEPMVAYRNGCRWTPSHVQVRIEEASDSSPLLTENGVYLITGGLGGVGLALADFLAGIGSARLALLTRRELPPREQWDEWLAGHQDGDRVSGMITKIRGIEAQGSEVMLISADVTDRARMREVVESVQRRFGAINGVIHAAGVAGGGAIQLKTRQLAEAVLAPKVAGTRALVAALGDAQPDFILLCSSIASLTGLPGQIDYTAANAFLDAFAMERRGDTATRIIAVNWGAWREVGMAVEADLPASMQQLRSSSLAMGMDNIEGGRAFERVLGSPWPQLAVSPQRLHGSGTMPSTSDTESESIATTGEGLAAAAKYQRPDLDQDYAAPTTETETQLALMWSELLGVEQVGINDSFLELGGHSLLATQLSARIRREFSINVALEELLASPTIAELATRIENLRWAGALSADRSAHADSERESDEI